MLPPISEPDLRACLAVLYRACIHARLLGYEGERNGLSVDKSRLLADLMDAVHNIPDLITRWPSCNQDLLRGMLADFDTKWSSSGIALLPAYDEIAIGSG
jgi:hypothetical protein